MVHEQTTVDSGGTALEFGSTMLPLLAQHSAGKVDFPETGLAGASQRSPHWGAVAHHLAA